MEHLKQYKMEYLFRGTCIYNHDWVEGSYSECTRSIITLEGEEIKVKKYSVSQATPFTDKTGKQIFGKDYIEIKTPYRTIQTHFGDNIPRGSYTEYMEPGIKIQTGEVVFHNGGWMVQMFDEKDLGPDDFFSNLAFYVQDIPIEGIKQGISAGQNYLDNDWFWNPEEPEECDLTYLYEITGTKTEEELCKFFSGVTIIGNSFDNPDGV